jgi:DNA polymerase-3 subunit beta
MEFTGDRNKLAEAIVNAANGIPTSPVQPVRAGMLITASAKSVWCVGSDGDTVFRSFTDAKISEPGTVVLPGRLLSDIVRSLPDQDVTFTATPELVTITCGRGVFTLQPYKDQYPNVPDSGETKGTIDAGSFSDAVKAVSPAASKKDGNPALHGLLLDSDPNRKILSLVATDRYRVASFDIGGWDADLGSCVIPPWAAERFRKGITTDEVFIGWDDAGCTMKSANFALTARRIAGTYADWRRFLPAEPPDVKVNAEGLLGAVKRASLAADADDPVELRFAMGAVRVSAGDATRAEETLGCSYDGGGFTALFGIPMLLDGLNGCEGEDVSFGFTESLQPVNLMSGRFMYTLLPRRRT